MDSGDSTHGSMHGAMHYTMRKGLNRKLADFYTVYLIYA
jgi:hypothetical protein